MPTRSTQLNPISDRAPRGLTVAEAVLSRDYAEAQVQDRLGWLKRADSNLQLAVSENPGLAATTYYTRWTSANAKLTALRLKFATECEALVTRMVGEDLVYLKAFGGPALVATGESLPHPTGLKVGATVFVWIDPIDGKVRRVRLSKLPAPLSVIKRLVRGFKRLFGRELA